MTLYWFFLVVGSIAVCSVPPQARDFVSSVLASLGLVVGWCVLILLASSTALTAVRRGLDELEAALYLERQLAVFRWSGLGVSAACSLWFGLAGAVQTWPFFQHSMTLQFLVVASPALLIFAATWLSEERYGRVMGYTRTNTRLTLREFWRGAMAAGGWLMVPVLMMLLLTDAVRATGWFRSESAAGLVSILVMMCVPVLIPVILRRTWRTVPLDPQHEEWMAHLQDTAAVRSVPVRIWDTGHRSYNALVAGFVPGLRTLIVTDRLLAEMPKEDLSLVILHELAHVKRCHVWLRVGSLAPCWILAYGLGTFMQGAAMASAITSLFAIAMTLLALRWVAHFTERDADRVACRLSLALPTEMQTPSTLEQAVQRYTVALRWVTRHDRATDKASWLHPSIDDRCASLQVWASRQRAAGQAALLTIQGEPA